MKPIRNILAALLLLSGFIATLNFVHAQDANVDWGTASDDQVILQAIELTSPIPATDAPAFGGTFYSAQHSPISSQPWPPLPANLNNFSVWSLGSNVWLLDDLSVDYSTLSAQTGQSMAMDGLTPEGDDGGTNTYYPFGNFVSFNPGTNPWIAQEIVSLNNFTGTLSNTVADVEYQLLFVNSLGAQWEPVPDGVIVGSETTNWTPWSIPFEPTTNFFLTALSYQDDSGTGIPDWWWLKYFGEYTNADGNALDPAGDGWTDSQKFAMGISPFVWVTPPAPQGASAFYNSQNQTVTLTWQPSLGNVTGYTITRIVPPIDIEQLATLSATATNFVDTSPVTNFTPEQGAPYYDLQATYALGNSRNAVLPMFDPNTAVSAQIVTANGGANLTLTSPMPPGTTALQLTRSDYDYGGIFGTYTETTFNIPASDVNGNTLFLPETDFSEYVDGDYYNEDWYVQTVNTNGGVSTPTQTSSDMAPLFFDGRQQLAQNLSFLLRAANTQIPISYYLNGLSCTYAFSGLYDETWTFAGESVGPYLDKFEPFEENYFFKNFVYSSTNVDQNGFLTTGVSENINYGPLYLTPPFTYAFQAEITNAVISPILDPSESQFITFYPQAESDYQIGYGYIIGYENGPDQYLGLTGGGGGAWTFSDPVTNYFGLPLTSVLFGYNQSGTYETSVLSLGDSNTNINNGGLYWQMASPELQTVGYYFAQPWAELLPGDPNFSVTNVTSTGLIAGFGQTSVFAGYAEQTLLNGIVNTNAPYAYLGQYFDAAYQIDTNGNFTTNSAGTVSPYGEFVPTTAGPAALVTMPNYGENVQGTGIVQVVKLVLDVNHDGVMDLSATGPDNTTTNTPYVFWANNNYDRYVLDSDGTNYYDDDVAPNTQAATCPYTPNTPTPDCNYLDGDGHRVIPCARDLEDFTRLWVCGITSNLLAALPPGCTVSLNWGDVGNPNSGNPTIDLFTAADANGGIGYLTNYDTSETQTDPLSCPYIGRLGPGSNLVLNASTFANNWAGNYLIWCGVSNGTGGLNLTIANSNGTVLAQTTAYIQIQDIKQMYERWTIGDNPNTAPLTNAILATEDLPPYTPAFQYVNPPSGNTPYILYVHGWNMDYYDKDRFAEAAFKRLYWQGYQGRFGVFRWPTDYGFTGATLLNVMLNLHNYDGSEFNAWESAQGLLNKLNDLNSQYPGHVYVLAHSMGNVVMGEALRLAAQNGDGQIVNTYVGSQAAIPAHVYDASVTSPYLINYEYSAHGIPAPGAPKTPNIYVNRLTNTVAATGRRISFYNVNDYALNADAWCFDQALKPDTFAGGYYIYNGSLSDPAPWNNFEFVFTGIDPPPPTYLDIVTNIENRYEALAYAANPYSTALGATPIITFDQIVDLTTVWPVDTSGHNYSDHFWHSAEFRGDAWEEWDYWQTLLRSPTLGFNISN